jgi:hypothetical protein
LTSPSHQSLLQQLKHQHQLLSLQQRPASLQLPSPRLLSQRQVSQYKLKFKQTNLKLSFQSQQLLNHQQRQLKLHLVSLRIAHRQVKKAIIQLILMHKNHQRSEYGKHFQKIINYMQHKNQPFNWRIDFCL